MTDKTKGIYLALATAFISGVAVFANKFAVGAIKSPLVFTTTKNLLVGLIIFSVLLTSGKWRGFLKLKRTQILSLILIGIIGGSLPFYLFFTGLSMIPAINAALIHKTLVIWVAILAGPFLKEKLSKGQGLAVLFLFLGNLLIGGFSGFEFSYGELMVLGATLLWAVENVIAKKILNNSVEPDLVTASRMGFGALILLVSALFTQSGAITQIFALNVTQWLWMLTASALLLGYVSSWYRALKFSPAIMVATILTGATLITNILTVIFITHVWNFVLLPQAVLIVSGLILYVYSYTKEFKVTSVQ